MFPQIFGKYVLERELASGGMARVLLATLRGAGGFEKRLVVKQIRPELASDQSFIRRFVAEAKTTVELSHANIVPVYELGAEQGTYYIAMEFCAGVSLAELLRAGAATPSEGAYIGVEICRALDYAHRKAGIVHRDVTPRNVMIDSEGSVRLIDFGIAASSAAEASGGPCFGSPGHMPPEQLSSGPLTPAADVFAVAVLLVETWTGRPPFRRQSFEASTRAFGEPRPPLSLADPSLAPLDPLIVAALSAAPSQRPQTAEEFSRPLREFLRQDDLGDIARRLGQRVSDRLAGLAQAEAPGLDAAPRSSVDAVAAGSAGGSTGSATLTFAARAALLEWTARIESIPPRQASSAPGAAEIESGMTAPSAPTALPREQRMGQRRRLVFGAALAASVVALLGFGGRELWPLRRGAAAPSAALGASTRAVDATRDARGSPKPAETFTPFASSVSAVAPALGQPQTPGPTPAPIAAAVASARTPLQRVAASEPSARPEKTTALAPSARLSLTSEPAAWVEIDGTRVGRTPLGDLGVSPGRHAIGFASQLLGERLETTVILAAEGSARVHADFTSANPQVYVR